MTTADARVEAASNGDAKPTEQPTDESFISKVNGLKTQSSGCFQFLISFFLLLTGTVGCTIFLIIIPLLPIAILVLGAMHKHDCTVEDRIPLWLMVAGASSIVRKVIALVIRHLSEEVRKSAWLKLVHLLDSFIIIWFFVGNAWVYSVYEPDYDDESSSSYCNKTVYLTAFVLITLIYAIILLILFLCLIIGILCACACIKVAKTVNEVVDEIEYIDADKKNEGV